MVLSLQWECGKHYAQEGGDEVIRMCEPRLLDCIRDRWTGAVFGRVVLECCQIRAVVDGWKENATIENPPP